MEQTFIILKPDAVQRQLVGPILSRFEQKGLKLAGLQFLQVSTELAEKHYAVHKERPFFRSLIDYITSGPVVAAVFAGPQAVKIARNLIGATNPVEAAPGTIRGDYGMQIGRNLVHGSDSPDNAQLEIELWFGAGNLVAYEPTLTPWILE